MNSDKEGYKTARTKEIAEAPGLWKTDSQGAAAKTSGGAGCGHSSGQLGASPLWG